MRKYQFLISLVNAVKQNKNSSTKSFKMKQQILITKKINKILHKSERRLENCINKIIRVGHFGVRGLSLNLEMRITYHLEP